MNLILPWSFPGHHYYDSDSNEPSQPAPVFQKFGTPFLLVGLDITMEVIVERLHRLDPRKPITLVAIDGRAGSGKSTLAAGLAKAWNAEIIQTDDFASWNNPFEWWPRLIEEALLPLRDGKQAIYRKNDFDNDLLTDTFITVSGPRVVLEGVSSSRREFRPFLDFAIWVETPQELCLKRGVERDGDHVLQRWLAWIEAEDSYIKEHQPSEYCNVTFWGS